MIKFALQILGIILISLQSCNTNEVKDRKDAPKRTWISEKDRTTEVTPEELRFYDLTKNLARKYETGSIQEVRSDITEIRRLLPKYATNWNYGNAIHKVNIIEGRIALQNGDLELAKQYLIEAGKTPGSPQLNSFGPNMTLAREFLNKNEKQIVIQYFDLCNKFWNDDYNKLDDWKKQVENGEMPYFGANLRY